MSVGLRYVHVPADGGEPVFLVGDTYSVLLRGEATGGRLGVVEGIVPAKAGPPLHTHHRESETFLVTKGVLTITAGDEEYDVAAGGLVYIPQGLSHRFFNRNEREPATVALLFTPAGMEDMFTDIGTRGVRGEIGPPINDADVAAMAAAGARYGYTFE